MIVNFSGTCRPSKMLKRLQAHQGDVSEGSHREILATRTILGKKVTFYRDGDHRVHSRRVSDEESYHSEILRFAHASLLINQPVGDKRRCYVDATRNPCEVWVCGLRAEDLVKQAESAIRSGTVSDEYVLDQHPEHSARILL